MTIPDGVPWDRGGDGGLPAGGRPRWVGWIGWSLALSMVTAGVIWILWTPYDPEAVWRPVPADAVYFSRHEHAADRWAALVGNPLTMTVFRTLGVEPSMLRADESDPATVRWIQRLFGRDVVLAYVPALGPGGDPAWVFSSWIGNRSQRLRWMLALGGVPWLQPVRMPGQTVFWKWTAEGAADRPDGHVSLALTDGLLMGAISRDPAAVRHLVATWDRRAGFVSLATTAWRDSAQRQVGDGTAADWGGLALRAANGPQDSPTSLFPALHHLEPAYAAGELTGSFEISAVERAALSPPPLDGLVALLKDAPVFWSLMSPALLTSLSRQPYTPRWALMLAETMMSPTGNGEQGDWMYPLFIAVLDERYAGAIRDAAGGFLTAWIRGLTVPAVVVGLYVGDETTGDRVFMQLLDQLNREYRLGLIPRRTERVTVVEETRAGRSFYDQLLLEEKVGVIFHDGWLVFAGQSSVLERLIDRQTGGDPSSVATRWLPANPDELALGYGWIDMEGFGTLAHDALAAVALMSLVRDPHGSLEMRRGLADIQAWISGLSPLRQGRVWLDAGDSRFRLKFRLGANRSVQGDR